MFEVDSSSGRWLRIVAYALLLGIPAFVTAYFSTPTAGIGVAIVIGFSLTLTLLNELYHTGTNTSQ